MEELKPPYRLLVGAEREHAVAQMAFPVEDDIEVWVAEQGTADGLTWFACLPPALRQQMHDFVPWLDAMRSKYKTGLGTATIPVFKSLAVTPGTRTDPA